MGKLLVPLTIITAAAYDLELSGRDPLYSISKARASPDPLQRIGGTRLPETAVKRLGASHEGRRLSVLSPEK